jgi:predicted NBD/HSP70 family sugar kinase
MNTVLPLVEPTALPPLDPGFRPAVLANRAFQHEVEASGGGVPLVIGLEQADGSVSRFEARVLTQEHPRAATNLPYAERIVKFLLWQNGGWRVYAGGPRSVGRFLRSTYAPDGARSFDAELLGQKIYQRPFTVLPCDPEEVPAETVRSRPLGRHLDGCRIGFDLGASDLKVSAVIDGQAVSSQEIVWEPVGQPDPQYHYEQITAALKMARSKLPRLDAIGGSSAGVYVDNQPRAASLFRSIPEERFHEIRDMFLRISDEFGVPLEVVNDGEVTALAGSMALDAGCVLGIAMGSSEAAGYVNSEGNLSRGLNELAFAPVDYAPEAPVDEWSGDRGVGALYFSQQCVFRLAPSVGIPLPEGLTKAEQLHAVQLRLEAGHSGAIQIWQTMGVYLGYGLAHYADFYDLQHVLILGRCTSGCGGPLLLEGAKAILVSEFPELSERMEIHLPDEKIRRVGQSIAAASLPRIGDDQ